MRDTASSRPTLHPDRLYRVTELSSLLGVEVRTLRRALHAGELARVNVDGWMRVWGRDAERWLESLRSSDPTTNRDDAVRAAAREAARSDAALPQHAA